MKNTLNRSPNVERGTAPAEICPFFDRRKIRERMARDYIDIAEQIEFFSDPEKAKQWLVGEGYEQK